MPAPESVRTVAVVGTGVIGGGWAAHFLRMGYDVVAYDPFPSRVSELVTNAWPALSRLGLAAGASPSRLSVVDSLAAAVSSADFVQESTPENLPAKIEVLRSIDSHTPPDVVVASSTSGFAMTDMQVSCARPERFVVGHPFNPPYLIPLVEVVGGAATSSASVEWAASFYRLAGKKPLVMDRELPGFIGNRLQEAMWREALHMVDAEEATVSQIDASIAYGPGLRWAQMGPCLTFHLAGGQGGMAHMLDHFGPALLEPWTRLPAPELTPSLRDRMVWGCLTEAVGRSITELEQRRDAFLVDLLLLLEKHGL
jgi:carnitine 3-dehydrogenase